MTIHLKRAYDSPEPKDQCRILVERLWPRGLSKEKAALDLWVKDAGPSPELRKWFNHAPDKWEEFKRRYFLELADREEALAPVREKIAEGPVTFVFASKETRYNNAVALKEFLERNAD